MMKSIPIVFVLFTMFLALLVVPVHSSVSVTSTISDSIYVVYDFQNLNSTVYDEIKANYQFNISAVVSTAIVKNLEAQGQEQVQSSPRLETGEFNDAARSISVSFYIWGSDIIGSTINRTSMGRTYQVKTDWRKFQLNLASSFSLNFTQLLFKPVAEWQKPSETTFLYEGQGVSFKFTLPEGATQVSAQGDIISYELLPSSWDVFVNSPFLILVVLILVIIIALIYRRVK
jgi:hypothetical protein